MKYLNPTTLPLKSLIAALLMIFCFACVKSDSDNPEPEPKPQITTTTFDKTEYFPFDPIMINLQEKPAKNEYKATLGSNPVTVIRMNDSTLVMMTPDIPAGEYLLTIPTGDKPGDKQYQGRLKVKALPTVDNPETVITEIMNTFDQTVADAKRENKPNAGLLESVISSLNDELSKMNAIQRQQFAAYWALHPELSNISKIDIRSDEIKQNEDKLKSLQKDHEFYLKFYVTAWSTFFTSVGLGLYNPIAPDISIVIGVTFGSLAAIIILNEQLKDVASEINKTECIISGLKSGAPFYPNYLFFGTLSVSTDIDTLNNLKLKNAEVYDFTMKNGELLTFKPEVTLRSVAAIDVTQPAPIDIKNYIRDNNIFVDLWQEIFEAYQTFRSFFTDQEMSGKPISVSEIKTPLSEKTIIIDDYTIEITSGNVTAQKTEENYYKFTTTSIEDVEFQFKIKAYNTESQVYTALLEVETVPIITTETILPDGKKGVPYSFTFTATGTEPILWHSSPTAGLTLNPETGVLSGVVTNTGTFTFTVKAVNDAGEDTKSFTLKINSDDDEENPKGYSFIVGTWRSDEIGRNYSGSSYLTDDCGNRVEIKSKEEQDAFYFNNRGEITITEDGRVLYKSCGVSYVGSYKWNFVSTINSNYWNIEIYFPTQAEKGYPPFRGNNFNGWGKIYKKVSGDMTEPYISVSPSELSFDAMGGEKTFSVISNTHWIVNNSYKHKFSLSHNGGGMNGTITVTVVPYSGSVISEVLSNQDLGEIDVTAYGVYSKDGHSESVISISLKQEAKTLTASPTTLRFPASGGQKSFNITSNYDWTVNSNFNRATISPTAGSKDGTVTVTVTATPSYNPTQGIINVYGPMKNVQEQIIIEQEALSTTPTQPTTTLTVSPTSLNFTASGEQKTFTVTSNTNWTVSSNVSWATVSPASGNNNGTVTVTTAANTTSNHRTATITVTGTGLTPQQISITQEAYSPTLTVTPTALNFSASGEQKSFNITSNTNWTVSSNVSWATVSSASGNNNGTVTITAAAYTGTGQRSAILTISASGVSSQTVSLTQGEGDITNFNIIGTWKGTFREHHAYGYEDYRCAFNYDCNGTITFKTDGTYRVDINPEKISVNNSCLYNPVFDSYAVYAATYTLTGLYMIKDNKVLLNPQYTHRWDKQTNYPAPGAPPTVHEISRSYDDVTYYREYLTILSISELQLAYSQGVNIYLSFDGYFPWSLSGVLRKQ